ncbi:hypothetical protein CIC12_11245, partial [Burkholderia sp. SG-MS1]|uniref:hypothetical protein n=1 Tax=Paraburkholderia sp. SG-MS1 TaxID=2023741 RepID=UPI001444E7D2
TPDDITDWQKIAKTPGNKETLAGFAMSRGLDQSVLQHYATTKGELTTVGKTRLLKAEGHQFKPTTPDDITDWQKIAKTPGNKET